ncbi:hypothetical protein EX30DRAFT_396675 [Ascodesmis nigricans]|uniref:Sin3 associated polypeptide p18 n=1 Tax=Ascodesmis nigricans TaxID=341454 RepID=A0A4S2MTM3_9PEZI|nr:hypothetical protein EX30DRAFT_396675 [Ascodesmis nigricans]
MSDAPPPPNPPPAATDPTPPTTITPPTPPLKVDRQRTTPFLLKLFYRQGGYHRLDDFRSDRQPREHIQIYTWRDCTLHELAMLLSDALPAVCPPRSRCGFRLIFADTRYGNVRITSKDLGAVVAGEVAVEDDVGAKKTLGEAQFVVGDWIDVAVYPEGHGGVSAPRGFGAGRGAPMRENGMGGYKIRGPGRGGFGDRLGGVPPGEWRRGENLDDVERGPGMGMGRGGGFRRGGGPPGPRRYRD